MNEHGDMLVAAPERWDEACFAVPALRALQAAGLAVGVLCHEHQAAFWQTLPGLEIVAFPLRTKAKHAARQITGKWQAAVLWENGFAAETAKIAAIPRRIGPAGPPLAKCLTHPCAVAADPLAHRVRSYLEVIEGMGIDTNHPEFFSAAAPEVPPQSGTLLLCPDSDFGPSHEWPLGRWQELAVRLSAAGWRLTVAGLPGGRNLGRSLAGGTEGESRFFEAVDFAATLPLLSAHAMTVAADGSLVHLAAHVGSTCVALFGPNDPVWKRPLGRRHRVARRHVECAPCLAGKCPLDQRCQQELTLERVLRAVEEATPAAAATLR